MVCPDARFCGVFWRIGLPGLGSYLAGACIVGCLYVQNDILDLGAPCRVGAGRVGPVVWNSLGDMLWGRVSGHNYTLPPHRSYLSGAARIWFILT